MFKLFKKKSSVKESEEVSEEVLEEASEEASEEPSEEASEEASEETSEEVSEEVLEETSEEALEEVSEEGSEEAFEQEYSGDNKKKKKGFFKRLFKGLSKSRSNLRQRMSYVFGLNQIDDDFYEELEEVLITSDMGVYATEEIMDELQEEIRKRKLRKPADSYEVLKEKIREKMAVPEDAYLFTEQPSVVLLVGVNGVGKTTTLGKLASKLNAAGKKVVICAADTFRAAAGEQLAVWAERAGCPIIKGAEGTDPSSILYDAINAAKSRQADILLVDTAGRLHNKKNLMSELSKMYRVIEREYPDAIKETLLVLDAATGQNALSQAKEFSEAANITGIVLTKMDSSAKGGIAVAVERELSIPVKYIGVGETIEDLSRFDPDDFIEALFSSDKDNDNDNDAEDDLPQDEEE